MIDFESDVQSSMYRQGSGLGSHPRLMMLGAVYETGNSNDSPKHPLTNIQSKDRDFQRDHLQLHDTANLSLEE